MSFAFPKMVLFLTLSAAGAIWAQKPCGAKLAPLLDGPPEYRFMKLEGLHAGGKDAIPALIADIDNGNLAPVIMQNLYWSSRKPLESPVYCGAVAAYIIELILGRTELTYMKVTEDARLLPGGSMNNYVYISGCIISRITGRPITPQSLPAIRDAYLDWWRKNQGRGLDALRKERREGKSPLDGTPYRWD